MATRAHKIAAKAALLSTTAIEVAPPAIGDNQPAVPSVEVTHADIVATLATMVDGEKTIEYARQRLAHLLFDRHAQLTVADDTTPAAADIAKSNDLFDKYLTTLTIEFSSIDQPAVGSLDAAAREKLQTRIRNRLARALRLFVNLAWFSRAYPDLVCHWDSALGRWLLAPKAFLPPTYTAGGSLVYEKDGTTLRVSVPLEHDDIAETYFVAEGKSLNKVINLSLDQLEHAIGAQIIAERDPNTPITEATPAAKRRAARQQTADAKAAADKAAAATAAEKDVANEDSDTPEATAAGAQGDRAWALEQVMRLQIALSKMMCHDALVDMRWSEYTKDALNAVTDQKMVFHRMDKQSDGMVQKANAAASGAPTEPQPAKKAA